VQEVLVTVCTVKNREEKEEKMKEYIKKLKAIKNKLQRYIRSN